MKRLLLLSMSLLCLCHLTFAQNIGQTKPISFSIQKEVKPALLSFIPESISFIDETGNNAIDASETCKIKFKVQNTGTGPGFGCVAKISCTGTDDGVKFIESIPLQTIPIEGIVDVEIPIIADKNIIDGRIEFTFRVEEPYGFGTDAIQLSVATSAFKPPLVKVADYSITGTLSNSLEKKKPFDLQVLLQNTQYGLAENIKVSLELPDGVYLLGGEELYSISQLTAGQQKSLEYSLIVNNSYTASSIPIKINIREKYGKYAEDKYINLALNQTFAPNKINVQEKIAEKKSIEIASLTSEVDKDIPNGGISNTNSFAFIIANEHYSNQNFAQVPYAQNDGAIFRNYCIRTLGIPEKNIHFQMDATYGQMQRFLTQLKNTAEVNPGSRIIFYYAGHGAPDEGTHEAFLVPVDAYQVNRNLCINLQSLYDDLKDIESSRITVFLDACFSGTNRDNTMMASARGVAIKPKQNTVSGNLVVFSAASGDETAWPYSDEGHGMFTYFLLKKLQETAGNVSYKELYDYLYENVRRSSNNINSKIQTPTVRSSYSLGNEWESWMLK